MSSLKSPTHRLKTKSSGKWLSFLGVLALLGLPITAPEAIATGTQPTVGMYLDQPFVEGSYVGEDFPSETSVTTFNDQSYGQTCSFTGAAVEQLYSGTPDCHVQTEINYGGASTTSSTPVVGEYPIPVNYGQVGGGGASIVFDSPQTYFGMWWSAGSAGNQIQLFSGSNLVANTSANDIAGTLYTPGNLTSQNGDAYATKFYIGNPVGWYSVGSPSTFSDQDPDNTYQSGHTMAQEPFVYIHFIAAAGVTFDRVNLIAPGNGFEFDNFTTSTSTSIASSIPSRLVLQRQLYEPIHVDFDANGGSGSLPRQYAVDDAPGYLQGSCLDWEDPTRCISALNNSYSTQLLGWNTASDGSGDSYYYEDWREFPFTENTTVYAQWRNTFYFYNLSNPDVDASNVWDYAGNSVSDTAVSNFADLTLPSPVIEGKQLEGWYSFSQQDWSLVRVGGPGDVISAESYTNFDSNIFGKWLSSVDAITPQVLLAYPRATSVELPNLPLSGDTSASICIVETDPYGNEISSNLQFTDLSTATSGFSSSYLISSSNSLITTGTRYVKVTVSPSSDSVCSSGNAHVVEINPLGASYTSTVPLYLTPH